MIKACAVVCVSEVSMPSSTSSTEHLQLHMSSSRRRTVSTAKKQTESDNKPDFAHFPKSNGNLKHRMRVASVYLIFAAIVIQSILWTTQPLLTILRRPRYNKVWGASDIDLEETLWSPTHRFLLIGDPQLQGTDFVRSKPYWIIGIIDLIFNDLYIKYAFQRAMFWFQPDTVIFLGDLISSQHISDQEFKLRVNRFKFIFQTYTHSIHIVGNHDVGYAEDMTVRNVERFERAFDCLVNSAQRILDDESLQIVTLNAMALEETKSESLHQETMQFIENSKAVPNTILLNHIPLHKEQGVCIDGPEYEMDAEKKFIRWQNMMSENASDFLIKKLNPRIIISGHDHEGCFTDDRDEMWEITVRSIMAAYQGHVGILDVTLEKSADEQTQIQLNMKASLSYCNFLPHVWVWVIAVVTGVLTALSAGLWLIRRFL